MNSSMGCSSVCEKNKDENGGEKLKESLLTLLIKLPFDRKYLLSNLWRKTSCKGRKNWLKNNFQILVKTMTKPPKFIDCQKLAVGVCQTCRSTARSTGQRSYFRPLCLRSTGSVDRGQIQRADSLSGRPPGRPGHFQRAELSGRSTGSVDRPSARSRRARCARRSTDPVDRLQT